MAFVTIVDDNEAQCRLMAKMMDLLGHSSATFPDAVEALAYLEDPESLAPDLIILDYMMPVMDGLEALRRLRADERGRNIAVVMFTADDDPCLINSAMRAGASAFWVKSKMEFADINRQVGQLLKGGRATGSRLQQTCAS